MYYKKTRMDPYCCRWTGLLSSGCGFHSPGEMSLTVRGVKASATTVTSALGTACCTQYAVEVPLTPAPTTTTHIVNENQWRLYNERHYAEL